MIAIGLSLMGAEAHAQQVETLYDQGAWTVEYREGGATTGCYAVTTAEPGRFGMSYNVEQNWLVEIVDETVRAGNDTVSIVVATGSNSITAIATSDDGVLTFPLNDPAARDVLMDYIATGRTLSVAESESAVTIGQFSLDGSFGAMVALSACWNERFG